MQNIEGVKERINFSTRLLLADIAILVLVVGSAFGRGLAGRFDIAFWLGLSFSAILILLGVYLFWQANKGIKQLETMEGN